MMDARITFDELCACRIMQAEVHAVGHRSAILHAVEAFLPKDDREQLGEQITAVVVGCPVVCRAPLPFFQTPWARVHSIRQRMAAANPAFVRSQAA